LGGGQQRGGAARLVAALNFWDKGGAFFTLQANGLGRGDYRVIDEDTVVVASVFFFWTIRLKMSQYSLF